MGTMHTEHLWEHPRVGIIDRVRGRRDAVRQRALDTAGAAIDRELAANLELTALFDQTHQAVVFENNEFARHGTVIARELPDEHRAVESVYARMPETETAMERRGPAGSLRPEDRAVIEGWEGDARDAQRALRVAVRRTPPSLIELLLARLHGGRRTGR